MRCKKSMRPCAGTTLNVLKWVVPYWNSSILGIPLWEFAVYVSLFGKVISFWERVSYWVGGFLVYANLEISIIICICTPHIYYKTYPHTYPHLLLTLMTAFHTTLNNTHSFPPIPTISHYLVILFGYTYKCW